jgi:GNAT superfamily N-acetyltransferase
VSVKNNPLVASIKAKLPSLEESNILANNIVNGHLSKLVSQINESILKNTQINIIKYQSASSESITDRLVEPIGFTSNYQYLCAFELESQQNKYFKLERMGSIENLEEIAKFQEQHKLLNPDVFGFNDSGEKFPPESKLLWLNSKLAKRDLGWSNSLDAKEAVRWVMEWEKLSISQSHLQALDNQILNFFEDISLPELFNSQYCDIDFFQPFFQKKLNHRILFKNRVGFLDTIRIDEEYQGQNIGSLVLNDLKYRYGDNLEFIGVKPYPLEFQDLSEKEFIKKDFDLKKRKVVNFYKKNGYKKVVNSDFYVLIL